MSAVGLASVAAFAGLGLVALSLWLAARRPSTAAMAIGLAGLLPLAGASAWLVRSYPAGEEAALDRLRSEIATQRDRITALEADAARSKGDIAARDKEIARLRDRSLAAAPELAEAVRARDAALAELAEARQANERLETDRARLRADAETQARRRQQAEQGAGTAGARAAELHRENEDQRRRLAQPTSSSPPPTPAIGVESGTDAPAHPRALLGRRITTPYYSVEPKNVSEQVVGLSGHWYVVRLKVAGERLAFPDRRFRLPESAAQLRTSARHFVDDVLGPAARVARSVRVFVRGGADGRQIVGPTDTPEPKALTVLQKRADGRHEPHARARGAIAAVRNDDLPALRADWLRSEIEEPLRSAALGGTIEILAEPPAPGRERTAELVIFVAW